MGVPIMIVPRLIMAVVVPLMIMIVAVAHVRAPCGLRATSCLATVLSTAKHPQFY
jgi:hypothetical protein